MTALIEADITCFTRMVKHDPCRVELKAMQSKWIGTVFISSKFLNGEQELGVIEVLCTH